MHTVLDYNKVACCPEQPCACLASLSTTKKPPPEGLLRGGVGITSEGLLSPSVTRDAFKEPYLFLFESEANTIPAHTHTDRDGETQTETNRERERHKQRDRQRERAI